MKKGLVFSSVFLLLIVSICLAGPVQFNDLGEIKGEIFTKEDTLRAFEAYRFDFEGVQCRLVLDSIKEDHVNFYFSSYLDTYPYENFTLYLNEKRTFYIDDDSIIDFTIRLDDIHIAFNKKRANVTISTDILADISLKPSDLETEDLEAEDLEAEDLESNDLGLEGVVEDVVDVLDNETEQNVEVVENNEKESMLDNMSDDFTLLERERQVEEQNVSKPLSSSTFTIYVWLLVLLIVIIIIVTFYTIERKKHNL